jgi:anti-sigma factor ChrR (cupin superfamily)
MMSVPAMRQRLSAMGHDDRPEVSVPLVMCPQCRRRPMAIKTVRQSLLGKRPADAEMICPACRIVVTVPTAQIEQDGERRKT